MKNKCKLSTCAREEERKESAVIGYPKYCKDCDKLQEILEDEEMIEKVIIDEEDRKSVSEFVNRSVSITNLLMKHGLFAKIIKNFISTFSQIGY